MNLNLQFFNNKNPILKSELNSLSIFKRKPFHKFLWDIESSSTSSINKNFSDSFLNHSYKNTYINKYMSIGVNKCKPYILQIYYADVHGWSKWKIRRTLK